MERDERIIAWTQAHREALLEDLSTLCRIASVSGPPAEGAPYGSGPREALDKAMDMCAGYGLSVRIYGDLSLTSDLGPVDRARDILAHLDVVDAGPDWDSDPFEPLLREDGFLYGRGVADDKGGAIAALYALRCVQELGYPMAKGCRLILGTNEENGSDDVAYYYGQEAPAPHTFTPDADFPVGNAEKGFYRIYFKKSWEDTDVTPRVTSLAGGLRVNMVPGEAKAVVSGMEPMHLLAGTMPFCAELGASCQVEETPAGPQLTVKGRGCHAAYPEDGTNALTALLEVLAELPPPDCPAAKAIGGLHRLLPHGDYNGKALGIAQADEETGALTCSLTQLDMTETGISGVCDCRIPLCATEENCRAVAEKALAEQGFEVTGMMIAPHHTPADDPFVRTLSDSYETYSGRPGGCYSMGGGTYVHDVPGGVAFGIAMPGVDARLHGANERIPVEDLFTAVEIFAQAIVSVCGPGQEGN